VREVARGAVHRVAGAAMGVVLERPALTQRLCRADRLARDIHDQVVEVMIRAGTSRAGVVEADLPQARGNLDDLGMAAVS